MMKQVIHTSHAPQAIGAYSQAVKVGNMVYFSGQIPLDPQTMQLVTGDFADQVQQVIRNLHEVALAAGGELANIVKLTVYLTDIQHYNIFNELMSSQWPRPFPARTVIGVNALPKAAMIEMDAIMQLTL